MEKYKFPSNPVADPKAVVQGPTYRFSLIHPMVLRYEWAEDGIFEDRASAFAINRNFPIPQYHIEVDTEDKLEIITPAYQVSYDKKRFSRSGLSVSFNSKVSLWGADWQFGKAPAAWPGNLGGTARTLDEVDGRCDMGHGILSREGHAALDDSQTMLFDGQGFVTTRRPGDRIDGYLFVYGIDYKDAMKAFYAISGPQPSLPRWSLGNWWSRYYKYTADSYIELMDRFKAEHVPLSVAVIDMDWHLVRDDRVPHAGWTGYTWDRSLFPDPEKFAKDLHDRKLKVTLNDHPHAGVHHHEDDYEEMAKALGHDTSKKAPILFDITSPEFLDAYLGVLHRNLEKRGCDFWWIDWQQGPYSRVPGLDPLWLLNHFHFLDNALYSPSGSEPIIFSRYAGPGSHRYPVGFSGDSIVTWDSLAFQPEFTATASNVGYGWWSHDLGGHMGGYRDDELTARWIQLGAFSPILRLHSSNSPWAGKEPWKYTPEAGETIRDAMRLRHRLVPYLYSESRKGDSPLCQPMYWSHPQREEAYQYPNQYTFGESLIIAPIVQPRSRESNLALVKVWIPPNRHVDLLNGSVYDGDRELDMYRPLENVPVLAPVGSVIPLDAASVPANGCHNPEAFEILVVVGKDGHFTIIENEHDDDESNPDEQNQKKAERHFIIDWKQDDGKLTIQSPVSKGWTVRFISLLKAPQSPKVAVNDQPVLKTNVNVEKESRFPGLVVALPEAVEGTVTIEVGANPQLSVLDHSSKLESMITALQINFALKDQIWGILQAKQPDGVKMGRLIALGLDGPVAGPLVELLVADSRTAPVVTEEVSKGGEETIEKVQSKVNGVKEPTEEVQKKVNGVKEPTEDAQREVNGTANGF